jgi:DNA-binding transcriptional ArsR family regulator
MIEEYEQEERFSKLASLIGEKVRAKMLWHLLDGRAYTALELAVIADISKQSCSNHLKKLVEEKILSVEKQGRHKYFRLYNKQVAKALEGIAILTAQKLPEKNSTKLMGIKYARSCYDHLAGYLGVAIQNGLIEQGLIQKENQAYFCTDKGISKFGELGIDISALKAQKRKFAYPCLDWSERKHHIGGALGAAILDFMIKEDWLRRKKNSRALILTSKGNQALFTNFRLVI